MNKSLPQILYKYKPINDFTRQLLTDNELYFSYPQDFNDPFDCFITYDYFGDKNDYKIYFDRLGLSKAIRDLLEKKLEDLDYNKDKIKGLLQHMLPTNETESFILYCLTTKFDNILMWSHYADNHKGICIGFKTEVITKDVILPPLGGSKSEKIYLEAQEDIPIGNLLNNKLIPVWKVIYDKLPEAYNGLKQLPSETIKFLKTKARDWEYEDEYRCLLWYSDIKKRNIKFSKSILKEVVFGIRTEDRHKDEIIKILRDNYIDKGIQVKAKQAVQSTNDYKLIIEDIKL